MVHGNKGKQKKDRTVTDTSSGHRSVRHELYWCVQMCRGRDGRSKIEGEGGWKKESEIRKGGERELEREREREGERDVEYKIIC